jgi:hypothetical protein
MYMTEAQSVPVVPDASLYPHVSICFYFDRVLWLIATSPSVKEGKRA